MRPILRLKWRAKLVGLLAVCLATGLAARAQLAIGLATGAPHPLLTSLLQSADQPLAAAAKS